MIGHNFLDSDRVQLFAIVEDDDIVGATIVYPVIRQGWMWLVKILGVILLVIGERVEEALQARLLVLADDNLLKHVFFACGAPLRAENFGIDYEILPELGIRLVIVRPRSRPGDGC